MEKEADAQKVSDKRKLRESDGSLKGLPRIRGARASYKIQEVAEEYARNQGLEYNPPNAYAPLDVKRAEQIAEAYDSKKKKRKRGPAIGLYHIPYFSCDPRWN
ncbi:MAG: hypothetical protein Q9M19_07625 [Mariprofundaceae bacterium]|nr:hypothetical protein [Mariprofundaceae bacterium]